MDDLMKDKSHPSHSMLSLQGGTWVHSEKGGSMLIKRDMIGNQKVSCKQEFSFFFFAETEWFCFVEFSSHLS